MNNDQTNAEFGTLSLIDDVSSPDNQSEKAFIPEGNLVELRFEDFESDAYAQTEMLYQKLDSFYALY